MAKFIEDVDVDGISGSMSPVEVVMIHPSVTTLHLLLLAGATYNREKLRDFISLAKTCKTPDEKTILFHNDSEREDYFHCIGMIEEFIAFKDSVFPSLQELSLHASRRVLGCGIYRKLQHLEIPSCLKDKLLLKELDDLKHIKDRMSGVRKIF